MKSYIVTILTLLPFFLFSQIQYDFCIGSCQSMFAESRYKDYIHLFDAPTKNGVPGASTKIKNHVAVTENATVFEIAGATQITLIMSFTQKSDSCFGSITVNIGKSTVFEKDRFNPSQQGLENFVNRYILKVQREWLIALIMNQNEVFLKMSKEKRAIAKEYAAILSENVKMIAKIEKMQIRISENNMTMEELKHDEEGVNSLMADQKRILESIDQKLKSIQ